jgi:hypothetical protein
MPYQSPRESDEALLDEEALGWVLNGQNIAMNDAGHLNLNGTRQEYYSYP